MDGADNSRERTHFFKCFFVESFIDGDLELTGEGECV